MKKFFPLLLIAVSMVVLTSCPGPEQSFDADLMSGTWVSGTEYWTYTADGLGHTWDTADDVTEEEAQQFTWQLDGATLSINHIGEMGEVIPKTYTVTKLTTTELQYKDLYNFVHSFTRVK